jgi:protein translocase SEC61 complex gamma subunit
LGIREFFASFKRLTKIITKPSRKEIWVSIKVGVIGITIIGVLGFIIKFLATMLQATTPTI